MMDDDSTHPSYMRALSMQDRKTHHVKMKTTEETDKLLKFVAVSTEQVRPR